MIIGVYVDTHDHISPQSKKKCLLITVGAVLYRPRKAIEKCRSIIIIHFKTVCFNQMRDFIGTYRTHKWFWFKCIAIDTHWQICIVKVQLFWEGQKNWCNLSQGFDITKKCQNLEEDCANFLWPSQKSWTLMMAKSQELFSISFLLYKN